MRLPHCIHRIIAIVATSIMALAVLTGHAFAQVVEITPPPTESPSSKLAPGTQWVYWMAIGAGIIVVLILLAVAAGYMRFAPKFFGREEGARPAPPGTRPPTLARAARMRYTPPSSAAQAPAPAPAPAQSRTATAVAERPATPAPAASAAPAAPAAPAPAEAATERVTASPSGEPAVQADAVGQAEAEAPEARPSAKTAEEVGAAPAQTQAPATSPPAKPSAQPAPTSHGGGSEMDQETFDRVLQDQLDRGVDRRVAEGRARAAAVVAARKKAQG